MVFTNLVVKTPQRGQLGLGNKTFVSAPFVSWLADLITGTKGDGVSALDSLVFIPCHLKMCCLGLHTCLCLFFPSWSMPEGNLSSWETSGMSL